MTNAELAALMDTGLASVLQAGAIAPRYFRTQPAAENKRDNGAFDPVTQADREIEAFLRTALERATPGIRIVGEEFGTTGTGDDYWIVDPIDGTRAFMSGMPTWGILLGLVTNNAAAGGIMHQPFTGETFIADPQRGARLIHPRLIHQDTEQPLATSRRTNLSEAILYSTDPSVIAEGHITEPFARLSAKCRLQRWGGDCYAFALLAQGSIDLVVEGALQPYDIVPMIAIIEQAGGVVTNLKGQPPLTGGTVVAAANRALHSAAIHVLTKP